MNHLDQEKKYEIAWTLFVSLKGSATYREIPIISPGLILVQKRCFAGIIFGGAFIIGRNFAFQNGLGFTIN